MPKALHAALSARAEKTEAATSVSVCYLEDHAAISGLYIAGGTDPQLTRALRISSRRSDGEEDLPDGIHAVRFEGADTSATEQAIDGDHFGLSGDIDTTFSLDLTRRSDTFVTSSGDEDSDWVSLSTSLGFDIEVPEASLESAFASHLPAVDTRYLRLDDFGKESSDSFSTTGTNRAESWFQRDALSDGGSHVIGATSMAHAAEQRLEEIGRFRPESTVGTAAVSPPLPNQIPFEESAAARPAEAPKVLYVSTAGRPDGLGTVGDPLNSIQAAADLAGPGTVINVLSGTYHENIRIRQSGTAEAPITIVSADGAGAARIIPVDQNKDTIALGGVDHVVVDGFTVHGPASQLHAIQIHAHTTTTVFDPATHITIQNNTIVAGLGDGIKGSKASNLTITGNTIVQAAFASNSNEAGIDFVGVNIANIDNNTITDMAFMAIMIKGGSYGIDIVGNVIDGSGTSGVEIGGYSDLQHYWPGFVAAHAFEARSVYFHSNSVINTHGTALRIIGAQDVMVANNHLATNSQYLITVDDSSKFHPSWLSSDVKFFVNDVDRPSWLTNRSLGEDIGMVNMQSIVLDYFMVL
jgi:hypothetical protein